MVAYVVLALLVAGAAFAAVFFLARSGHEHNGSGGGPPGGTGAQVPLSGVGNYVPSGSPDTHADTAGSATDGNPDTYWFTQIYNSPDFGGLLPDGLGLVLDAGGSVRLAHLTVTTPTPGFTAQILAGDSPDGGFTADSSAPEQVSDTTTFTLDGRTARYYVVLITSLPSTPDGYMAKISEVTATS